MSGSSSRESLHAILSQRRPDASGGGADAAALLRSVPLEKAAQIRTLNAKRSAQTAAMSGINSRWLRAPDLTPVRCIISCVALPMMQLTVEEKSAAPVNASAALVARRAEGIR